MNKQVLIETSLFQPSKNLVESTSPSGNMQVEGILTTVNQKNGNQREYPEDLWKREIDKYQSLIKENRAIGELDHPETGIINLQNVSHCIKSTWWDGDNIMGRIEILPTPAGNILKSLIDSGIVVGVSSRGEGSVKQIGGVYEVQDDFNLICWDFVSTPSNPGSFMSPVQLNENKQTIQSLDKYRKVDDIIREILCSKGSCPLF